jgi:hypothetical protein
MAALVSVVGSGLVACSTKRLEITTLESVEILEKPQRSSVVGNRKLGVIPANITLPVRNEVITKDLAAYEVEYVAENGARIRGYVLLGRGVDVKALNRK